MTIKNRMRHGQYVTKQKAGMDKLFDGLFVKESFDTIIEIGTLPGGFALYLAEKALSDGAKFHTFEIREVADDFIVKLESLGGEFHSEDVIKGGTIPKLIEDGGRVLILNDGIKVEAFKKFAPILKIRDCIFTHDYGEEWQLDDIKNTMIDHKLKMIFKEFEEYLWLCCIKK